jgi:hypothetical protein
MIRKINRILLPREYGAEISALLHGYNSQMILLVHPYDQISERGPNNVHIKHWIPAEKTGKTMLWIRNFLGWSYASLSKTIFQA